MCSLSYHWEMIAGGICNGLKKNTVNKIRLLLKS